MGVRRFGVPVGGWFDRSAAMCANVLAGRAQDAPCLELTLAQVRFRSSQAMSLAVTGAASEVRVDGRPLGGRGLFWIPGPAEIAISSPSSGVRSYVSASFTALSPASTRLARGDVLKLDSNQPERRPLRLDLPQDARPGPLRVAPGPQASLFDLEAFADSRFTVSPHSNRVGIRMVESFQAHGHELPSEPAGFGAVQVTAEGAPIILGPDGPTIGGYPKIAYVISADLDRLAWLRPGAVVGFEWVDIPEARRLSQEKSARLARRIAELAYAVKLL